MQVFVCEVFDDAALKEFSKARYHYIVAIEIKINADSLPTDVKVVSAIQYNIEGSWESHRLSLEFLKSVQPNTAGLINFKGYVLDEAILKSFIWKYYSRGLLEYSVRQLRSRVAGLAVRYYSPSRIYLKSAKDLIWLTIVRCVGWYFPDKVSQKQVDVLAFSTGPGVKAFVEPLIRRIESKGLSASILDISNKGRIALGLTKRRYRPPFSLRRCFRNPEAYRALISYHLECVSFICEYESLFKKNTSSFITVAMENNWQGHLICEMSHRNSAKAKVFNVMNGAKFGSANNVGVTFDHWFVWSEGMRRELVEKCRLNPDSLVPLNLHLSQGIASSHRFKGALKIELEQIKERTVLSLFPPRSYSQELSEVLNVLSSQVTNNLLVIIRPHPGFTAYDKLRNEISKIRTPIVWVDTRIDKSKDVYYDQLILTDAAIVFASTVAYECTWFGIKVTTYETTERSLLPDNVDGRISHSKDPLALRRWLADAATGKKAPISTSLDPIEEYANFIIHQQNV